MLINNNFDDIFLINRRTGEIHAASRMSGSCNVEGNFDVIPTKDAKEQLRAFCDTVNQIGTLDFCGHCFPGHSKR